MIANPPNPDADNLPLRCVSVDVEEYFHIEAAFGRIDRSQWDVLPSRVEHGVDILLDLFQRRSVRATFFILGVVARRTPAAVRAIADAGHEVASHGTGHDRLHRLTPDSFRDDLLTSKKLLEDLIGRPVQGYRAPTFSLVPQTAWAVDVLVESGFTYDSSIYPVHHPLYGVPHAPDRPFFVQSSPSGVQEQEGLLEIPPLTWRVAKKNLAVAGGGYFRLLPLGFMRRGLAQAAAEGRPAILYFHPWEFDPGIPRMKLGLVGNLRTYTGLKSAARRLESILRLPGRWSTLGGSLTAFRDMAARLEPFSLQQSARTSEGATQNTQMPEQSA